MAPEHPVSPRAAFPLNQITETEERVDDNEDKELPAFDIARFDKLEGYALALAFAHWGADCLRGWALGGDGACAYE